MVNKEHDEDTVHDFSTEGKWVFLVAGYKIFKKSEPGFVPYFIYRGIMFLFLIYLVLMSAVAAFVSYGNNVVTIQAIHIGLLAIVSFLGLFTRIYDYELLNKASQFLRAGVFYYNEEALDEEHNTIKKKYVRVIRRMTDIFTKLMLFIGVSNTVFISLIQLLIIDKDTSKELVNPYLPQPIYMPFSTRTYIGYASGFIIIALFMVCLISLVICMDSIYLSFTLQLKAQFEILNYSLRNLEKRAYSNVIKRNSYFKLLTEQELYGSREFQNCIYNCLKSNVKHHQALIELKHTFQHYLGLIFLIVVCLASFILAAHVILILEMPEIPIMVNFIITLFCEMLYTLHYCWYGEELIQESSAVYYSLYATPWYNCDYRIRKLLSIMMANTRKPIQIRTVGFNITASLQTFGSIISTMYQIMNVVRNKKS